MLLCLANMHPSVVDFKRLLVEGWTRELLIAGSPNKFRRRGGWAVKPRQYKRFRPDEDQILTRRDYWECDTSQCNRCALVTGKGG